MVRLLFVPTLAGSAGFVGGRRDTDRSAQYRGAKLVVSHSKRV